MLLAFLLTHADTNYVRLAAGLTAQCIPDNHPLCPKSPPDGALKWSQGRPRRQLVAQSRPGLSPPSASLLILITDFGLTRYAGVATLATVSILLGESAISMRGVL
jgi:hypothetical protein